MTPEEKKKKQTSGEKYQENVDTAAQAVAAANNAAAEAVETQGQQLASDMAYAQAKQRQDQTYAQNMLNMAQQDNQKSFAALANEYKQRIDNERAEAQKQVDADKKAATATSFAEFGSALANLIGVGGYNAVSQQYKNYSQDWMKKADQDMREHRSRVDNLLARQDALKERINQLRLADANQAIQLAQQRAAQDYQNRMAAAQLRSDTATKAAQLRAQGAKEAAETQLKGAQQATAFDLQERGQNISAQQHNDTMKFNLAKAGLKKNDKGEIVVDENSAVYKANKKALTDESHKGKNKFHYTDPASGELVPIWMTAAERDGFLQRAKAELDENPEFKRAYMTAADETTKKSLIFQYAQGNEKLRKELSQYGDNPEVVDNDDDAYASIFGGSE